MEGEASEWEDGLSLLEAALPLLADGEMVKSANLSLMDLMGAIEILDPRTDSYSSQQSTSARAFDPVASQLPLPTLISVLDTIFQLEQTYWDGVPLISTLWTCHYFRPTALAALSTSTRPTHQVLKAYLLATVKVTELAWEELAKNNVHEHEDVSLNLSSLGFQTLLRAGFYGEVGDGVDEDGDERMVETDECLRALDEALGMLNETFVQDDEQDLKQALVSRLAIRMDLLMIHAFLLSPLYTTPDQIHHHLSRVTAFLPSLLFTSAFSRPPPAPPGAFGPAQLPAFQPIRIIPPISFQAAVMRLKTWSREISWAVEGWEMIVGQSTDRDEVWTRLEENAIGFQGLNALPYSRSVYQSLLTPPFPPLPFPLPLTSSFITIHHTFLTTLMSLRALEKTWDSPARKILAHLDAIEQHLTSHLKTYAKNPGRARRVLVKDRKTGRKLVEEGRGKVDALLMKVGFEAGAIDWERVEALQGETIVGVLLTGSGLDLWEREEDLIEVWWVLQRASERVESLMKGEKMLARKKRLEVMKSGCRASFLNASLSRLRPSSTEKRIKKPSRILPVLLPPASPSNGPPSLALKLDEARFIKRFAYMDDELFEGVVNWERFGQEVKALELSKVEAEVRQAYAETRDLIHTWLDSYGEEHHASASWMNAANLACSKNLQDLDASNLSSENGKVEGKRKIVWDRDVSWFPVFETSE